MKKLLSLIICLCLLVQVLPLSALADTATSVVVPLPGDTTGDTSADDTNDGEGIVPDDAEPELEQCGDDVWWTLQNGHLNITGTGPMWNWAGFTDNPWCYYNDEILYITLSEGITEIGCAAFMDCKKVTEIIIPESVTRIGSNAFQGCEGLISMRIPAAVTSIEHDAFTACLSIQGFSVAEENTAFKEREGCLYTIDGKTLRNYPLASSATSFTIPSGTTTIGSFAFGYSENLKEVNFNDGLVFIDDYAFTWVENLTRVDLPDSLKKTGGQIFGGCTNLVDINLPATMERIGGKMLMDTAYYSDWSNWTDGVLYLDNYLLETVYLPSDGTYTVIKKSGTLDVREGTTLIAEEAADMSDITAVNFNDELLHIGFSAFSWLDLETVTLPDSLLTLGDWAFYNCTDLENIYIGPNLQYIGHDPLGKTAFDIEENYEDGILYHGTYLLKFNDDLPDEVVIKDGTTLIAERAFYVEDGSLQTSDYGASMTSISFPDSLTTICDGAFYSCLNLKEVKVPSTVTTIGDKALGWKKWYDRDREEEAYAKLSDFTLYCYEGSAAEAYAMASGIHYERPPIVATSVTIDGGEELSGQPNATLPLSVTFGPENCIDEQVTYISSDDSVVFIVGKSALLVAAGTATITAISENGLEDTITVRVIPHTIALGVSKLVTFAESNTHNSFLFTADESTEHSIKFESDHQTNVAIYTADGSTLVDCSFDEFTCDLTAGTSYLIVLNSLSSYVSTPYSGYLSVKKIANASIGGGSGEQSPELTRIIISSLPNKTTYAIGDAFDNAGMVVEAVYTDGSREVITNYTIAGYDCLTPGKQTLTVTYSYCESSFTVTVTDTSSVNPDAPTTSLVITSVPNKVTYFEGEALNTTGMVVEIHWADGSESVVNGWSVSGYDPHHIGTQTLVVTWEGLFATFEVDVYANIDDDLPYPVGITVTPPNRTTYNLGELLDPSGMIVTIHYSDNSSAETWDWQWGGYSMDVPGTQTVTVHYGDLTDTFEIYISDTPILTGISLLSVPTKTSYFQGDALDVTGGKLKLTYSSGDTDTVALRDDMVTNYNKNKVGKQTLKVTYEGHTTTYQVTVKAISLIGIAMHTLPKKLTYVEGQELSVSGGKIIAYYNNDDSKIIPMTTAMVSGYIANKVRKQTLTVTYGGKRITYSVTVAAKVLTGIKISRLPDKTTYYQGDSLSTRGLVLTLTYNDESTTKTKSGFKASGDLKTTGTKTISVIYKGYKATYKVQVKALKTPTLSITGDYFKYKLAWNKVAGAGKYAIYYRLYSNNKWSGWKHLLNTSSGINKYTHIVTVKNNNKYQYAVKAVNGSVETKLSNVIKVLPNPQKFKATNTNKGIRLSWSKTKSIDGKLTADKYYIYRRTNRGEWKKIKTVTSTSYTDTTVKAKKTYQYRIKAVTDDYTSYYSSSYELKWLKAPTSIKATKASKGVKVSWSKVTGASWYEVYRRTGSGKWTLIDSTRSTSYADKGAKKGKTYTYRVCAFAGSNSRSEFKTSKKIKQ